MGWGSGRGRSPQGFLVQGTAPSMRAEMHACLQQQSQDASTYRERSYHIFQPGQGNGNWLMAVIPKEDRCRVISKDHHAVAALQTHGVEQGLSGGNPRSRGGLAMGFTCPAASAVQSLLATYTDVLLSRPPGT